jgi:hypothetical protein
MESTDFFDSDFSQTLHNLLVDIASTVNHGRIKELSLEYIKESHPNLNQEQQEECLDALKKYYHKFSNDLNSIGSWWHFVLLLERSSNFEFLDKASKRIYNEKFDFIGPSTDDSLNIPIKAQVNTFILEIEQTLWWYIGEIFDTDETSFCFKDSFLLSNSEIMDIVSKTIKSKSPLEQIKYLIDFKGRLHNDISLFKYAKIFENQIQTIERDFIPLYKWVDDEVLIQTAFLEPELKSQVRVLNSKHTFFFDYLYFKIKDLTAQRINELSIESISSCESVSNTHYQDLSTTKRIECVTDLQHYYEDFQDRLTISHSWDSLLDLLDKSSKFAYFDGRNIIGPSNDGFVNITIERHADDFISSISNILKSAIKKEIIDVGYFHFEDIPVLSNTEIIDILCLDKSPLSKIKHLIELKSYLQKEKSSSHYFDFSVEGQILGGKRDVNFLYQWIYDSIFLQTPILEFKSDLQVSTLRDFVSDISFFLKDKTISERLNDLIKFRSEINLEKPHLRIKVKRLRRKLSLKK